MSGLFASCSFRILAPKPDGGVPDGAKPVKLPGMAQDNAWPVRNNLRGVVFVGKREDFTGMSKGCVGHMRWTAPLSGVLLTLVCGVAMASVNGVPDRAYSDKVRGAWLGKCIGGALGMPLEGWNYRDIAARYPKLDGYVGYFHPSQVGWSGMLQTVRIPKDGGWTHLQFRVRTPEFDTAAACASPILGMSLEESTAPGVGEVRNLRILRPGPGGSLVFNSDNWLARNCCVWTGGQQADQQSVRFDFDGARSWLKLHSEGTHVLDLKPGQELLISCDARWISGDNRIGLALDYDSRGPRKGFGPDDDTSYQVMALHALKVYGPDLDCQQIGREWVERCPDISVWLAEGLALKRMKEGILPPKSGEHEIGEAIGGQMRGEIWGLVCPERPDLAAEYARRDAVVSHCRNGVYGEQFVSAMMSKAFTEKDPARLIQIGLQHVPADSQLAATVRWVIDMHAKNPDYHDTVREIVAKYPNPCNPLYPDAGIVTLALLYGGGDFEKTILIAASCGSDTDCDTATVGALLGCIKGAKALPEKWTAPVDDSFTCFAKGLENWSIRDLARAICEQGRRVTTFHGDGTRFTKPL